MNKKEKQNAGIVAGVIIVLILIAANWETAEDRRHSRAMNQLSNDISREMKGLESDLRKIRGY